MPDVSAAPSAAPETVVPQTVSAVDHAEQLGDVSAYRAARAAERYGQPLPPVSTPSTDIAESSPAEPAEQAASTEASPSPASEPGKPRKGADARISELLEDRRLAREKADRLERELADLRSKPAPAQTPPAASSPAPVSDPEPQLADFENDSTKYPDPYAAYVRAVGRWEARQEFREQQRVQREQSERESYQRELQQQETGLRQAITEAGGAEFLHGLTKIPVAELVPFHKLAPDATPTALNALATELYAEPAVAPQILRHLNEHPEEFRQLATLPPRALLRAIGRIEGRVAAAKVETPAPAPVKTITSAPPPPVILGSKTAPAADETEAAAESGDIRAYRAARLRTATAQRRLANGQFA